MPLNITNEDYEMMILEKIKPMEPFIMEVIEEIERRFPSYEEGFCFIEDNATDEYIRYFMLKIYEVRNKNI